MNYGLYVPNFGAFGDPATMVSLAESAEANGWDGFFIWDHIAGYDNTMCDPWAALGAVAQATERIRIGTTVTPVPRRRPHKLARETVTVDRLSGGRLVFGVGSGEGPPEYDRLGEPADHRVRGEMLDEALDVITRLWSGEVVDHVGTHYRVEGARFRPTPLQQPRIPVWVGGVWPHRRPMRRAAKWDGVIPLFDLPEDAGDLAALRACLTYIKEHRSSDGPFDVVYTGTTPGHDRERTREIVERYRDAGVTWWLESIAPYRDGRGFGEPWDLERLRERVLQGPPPT
jgi:alkanesulfonate monooxygenase SsuD/methylene tetrahydromethanopterin reductase-like flavin-dependent oxidoreductase (luciferase family)